MSNILNKMLINKNLFINILHIITLMQVLNSAYKLSYEDVS